MPHSPMGKAAGRTAFDQIYDQPDPRAFFNSLGALGYQTPHHAQPVFRRVLAARAQAAPVAVLDVCCSYGINAALLNHHLTLDDLYAHYTSPRVAHLDATDLIKQDKDFYAARRRADAVPVIGLDIASHAIDYAVAVGLLDAGFDENLEHGTASPNLRQAVDAVGLITVTGGMSFLSAATFQQLLGATSTPVWVAAFVLRTTSYRPIIEALATHGLTTEVDTEHTVVQRRFTDPAEQRYAVAAVTAAKADPVGKELEGCYHAGVYVSRPPQDLAVPYKLLVTPTEAAPMRRPGTSTRPGVRKPQP